jgi:uncharacterized protein (DUF433 family)
MTENKFIFLNTGIYSVPEASRLTSVSAGRIRRWLKGYRFKSGSKRYASPPLWRGQLEPIDKSLALGFLDLIEIRFVDKFIDAGVSWTMLRKVRERAMELFKSPHPFCSNKFFTDGREILVELHEETGEQSLVEIIKSQHVFRQILKPFLKELEFGKDNTLLRWWPLGEKRSVVLDPKRSFGQPIVSKDGVPTHFLAKALQATGSLKEVAQWYEVSEAEVKDAAEFEQKLVA